MIKVHEPRAAFLGRPVFLKAVAATMPLPATKDH